MSYQKYKEEVLSSTQVEKLKFEQDDKNHYVYRVSKDGNHYYGSRTDRDNKTIGDGYYTSSTDNIFYVDFKKNPDTYKVKVVRKFNNSGDKILFESYLHNYFDVKRHGSFINKANQTPFGFDRTGVKHDMVAIQKIILETIKNQSAIKADPKRYETRRKNKSAAAIKFHLNIKNDAEKYKTRSEKLSKASLKTQEEIRNDPERRASISKKQSDSHLKNCLEIRNDPERYAARIKAHSKPVYQYDLDNNFIKEFQSSKEAAQILGYPNASGIGNCVTGRQKTCKGSIWKREKPRGNK